MKVKKNNLNDELLFSEDTQTMTAAKKPPNPPIVINYDSIIEKQSQIIENLYKQCTALRLKINRLKSQQLISTKMQSSNQQNVQKLTQMLEKQILKQMATLLDIPEQQITRTKILQSIKRILWQRQKRSEPIFIQSKKEIRVPVPVEIIVQKPVEKIVYRQKIVQVPVFKQKIVEKFTTSKIVETSQLLSTISNMSSEENKHNKSEKINNENSNFNLQSSGDMFLSCESVIKEKKNDHRDYEQKDYGKYQGKQKTPKANKDKFEFYRPEKTGKEKQPFYQKDKKSPKLTLDYDDDFDDIILNKTTYVNNNKPTYNNQNRQTNKPTHHHYESQKQPHYPSQIRSPKYTPKNSRKSSHYQEQQDYYHETYDKKRPYNNNNNQEYYDKQEQSFYGSPKNQQQAYNSPKNEQSQYRSPKNEQSFYRSPTNKTIASPKGYYQKGGYKQSDVQKFYKSKNGQNSQLRPNKNTKKRANYDFYDRDR